MFKDCRDFTTQLSKIKDKEVRHLAVCVLQNVPQRFFTMPASTTGKYHSKVSLGEGGLVRHTKLLVKILLELLELEQYSDLKPMRDELICAGILHDSLKAGWNLDNEYTVNEHPNLAADFVMEKALEMKTLPKEVINRICHLIRAHSGQWDCDGLLPKPVTNAERLLHVADYLSSRKWIYVEGEDLDV